MPLQDLPLDIILKITEDQDLPDSLHLLSTCTAFKPIFLSSYFWIASLRRFEQIHRRPLPCSPGTDILSLPLATLRRLAVHAYKLKKNWESEAPVPVSVHSFEIFDVPTAFSPIHGTPMIVTISRDRLACLDAVSGECIGSLDHTGNWVHSDVPFLRPGVFSIGMAYPSVDRIKLAIVSIDYGDPSAVNVSEVFAQTWTATAPLFSVHCIVTNETAVASIVMNFSETFLLFCRVADGIIHRVPLERNPHSSTPKCTISEDGILITRQSLDLSAEVVYIRPTTNPVTFEMHKVTRKVPNPMDGLHTFRTWQSCNPRTPNYGVLNVTCRAAVLRVDENQAFHSLHFWPAEFEGSSLTVGPLCFFELPIKTHRLAVGSSATSALVIDRQLNLALIQYVPQPTPHAEFRSIQANNTGVTVVNLALDDRLGILYVVKRPRQKPQNGEARRYNLTVASYA
ncbi:hypothetical protein B0H11DRAFT_1008229 [Mycena galericulata]|nr:hypothetical protein B0H11DRAFT_1008229 [Mycena galericulata]